MAIDHEIGQLSRHIGQKTEEWRAGYCKLSLDLDERHLNRSGTVDGGIFAVMIDSAGAYAGTYPEAGQPKRDCATITMTINYAGQPQGKRLIAEGEMRPADLFRELPGDGRTRQSLRVRRLHVSDLYGGVREWRRLGIRNEIGCPTAARIAPPAIASTQ